MSLSVPFVTSSRIYIKTSPERPCPPGNVSCMTLQQYINETNNSSTPYMDTVSLELQPGTHPITSIISVSNITSLEMYSSNAKILCNANSSGVLHLTDITLVNISGISFTNCSTAYFQSVAELIIQDSMFRYHGPVVLDNTNSTITNTSFWNGQTLNLTTSRNSSQCYQMSNGGAIRTYNSSIFIEQSTFENNTANCLCPSSMVCGRGGAIYAQDTLLTINITSFVRNTAVLGGGAIYAQRSEIMVHGSVFGINNAVGSGLRTKGGEEGTGGALSVTGGSNISISDCKFTENKALTKGSSLYVNSSNGSISESLFLGSTAGRSVGAVFISGNNTKLNISRSNFIGYSGGGGVIHNTGYRATIILEESRFSNNSADQCTVLRVINSMNSTIALLSSNFTNNTAERSSSGIQNSTGGVACISGASINITRSSFHQNVASGDAGVLQIENSTLSVLESAFTNNRAGGNGGVINTALSPVGITTIDSEFRNNQAGGDGGVINVVSNGSSVQVQRSSFTSNTAARRGGVIAIERSELNINQTTFYNNTAPVGEVISACNSNVVDNDNLVVPRADLNDSSCTVYDNPNVTTTDIPETNGTSTPTEANTSSTTSGTSITTTNIPETNETSTGTPTVPSTLPTTPSTIATPSTPTASTVYDQYTTVLYATLGIAIGICVLVLTLYIIVICIVIYLCGAFKSKQRLGEVNNPYVYVPMNENETTSRKETPS